MNLTDELERLSKLHNDGTLSDEEFAQAKNKLLKQQEAGEPTEGNDPSPGDAANQSASLPIIMGVIGVIILLIILFGVVLPHLHHNHTFQFQFHTR